MLQNLKVDIIYYKTNTDFEMEFNLCGCCRMRLLTDKASDKKTLVHDLARAVSRSRVIIIAGELSGEEGIIQITARSIAKTVTQIDKSLYGIKSEEEIGVINGATPLVTPDGEFGGCIIESGPQSMILLSDDKAIRKTVMNTLIHPYIEELCALDLKAKAKSASVEVPAVIAAPETQTVDIPEENGGVLSSQADTDKAELQTESEASETEIASDTQAQTEPCAEELPAEDTDETQESKQEEELNMDIKEEETTDLADEPSDKPISAFSSKPDVSLSGGMAFETEDYRVSAESSENNQASELFIEPDRLKKSRIEYYNRSYSYGDGDDSPYRASDDSKEKLKSGFSGNLAILIISVLLLLVLAVLCYCIFYVPAKDGISASAYLSETFSTLFG